ncbi:MAG TPA: hypothetical protein VFU05_10420 [Cyclobacteriaceae bacterium]|nr:hypothetical protein [Cyclobacteriaceae bacterium]
MKKTLFALSALLMIFSTDGFSQTTSSQPFSSTYEVQKIPANPDVAQLGKFGDVPVNKYNGTANISVPIHEIDLDGLEIPIARKYLEVGAFKKFIENPVSLHMGLHHVTIPLFEIPLEGLAIPISLKYHF